MATVFPSQLVPTSSHKELNLSQSQSYLHGQHLLLRHVLCHGSLWPCVAMCGHVTHLCRCHRNAWKAMKTSLAWEPSPPSTPRSADSGIQFILNVMWNQTIKTFLSQCKNKKIQPILRALSPEFSAHLYHVAATTHIYVLRLHIQIYQQAVGIVLVVLVQRTWMKRTHGCTHLTTSQSYDTHMTYMTYSLHTQILYIY